jgi:hypothetical protein
MNKEQQRIKIAEACGWKVHPNDRFIVIPPNSPHSVQPLSTIPDYLNDLNAMHEAEKVLTNYQKFLQKPDSYCTLVSVTSTAAQRAEAFLRTLNLWEE